MSEAQKSIDTSSVEVETDPEITILEDDIELIDAFGESTDREDWSGDLTPPSSTKSNDISNNNPTPRTAQSEIHARVVDTKKDTRLDLKDLEIYVKQSLAHFLPLRVLTGFAASEPWDNIHMEINWGFNIPLAAGSFGRATLAVIPKQLLNKGFTEASGHVWKDNESEFEPVVYKTALRSEDGGNDTVKFRGFLKEIVFLSTPSLLRHQNIVDILGYTWQTDWQDGNSIPTLILEFASIGSLSQFFKHKTVVDYDCKLGIAIDICHALKALHHDLIEQSGFSLYHGDLKAGNILLFEGPQGRVQAKLSDFGTCETYSHTASNSRRVDFNTGTVEWRAPELLSNLELIDPLKSEIYSLGLLFCYILFDGCALYQLPSVTEYFGTPVTNGDLLRHQWNGLKAQDPEKLQTLLLKELESRNLPSEHTNRFRKVIEICLTQHTTRCNSFSEIIEILGGDPSEIRLRSEVSPLQNYLQLIEIMKFHSLPSALNALYSLGTLPYAFKNSFQQNLQKTYTATEGYTRGHAALLLGLSYFVTPLPTAENSRDEGLSWIKASVDAGYGPSLAIYRRLAAALGRDYQTTQTNTLKALSSGSPLLYDDLEKEHPLLIEELYKSLNKNPSKLLVSVLDKDIDAETAVGFGGETMTHFAASENKTALLSYLQSISQLSFRANTAGDTPLIFACRNGHFASAKTLLLMGHPLDQDTPKPTPLHYLYKFRDPAEAREICELLLRSGTPIDGQTLRSPQEIHGESEICYVNDEPGTPLHWAVAYNSTTAAALLLENGANPFTFNKNNQTPWGMAVSSHLVDILKKMVKVKARFLEDFIEQGAQAAFMSFTTHALYGGLQKSLSARSCGLHHMLCGGEYYIQSSLETFDILAESRASDPFTICGALVAGISADSLLFTLYFEQVASGLSDNQIDSLLDQALVSSEIESLRVLLKHCRKLTQDVRSLFVLLKCILGSNYASLEHKLKAMTLLLSHTADERLDLNTRYKWLEGVTDIGSGRYSIQITNDGSGSTLLHTALSLCMVDVFLILVDFGGDPIVTDGNSVTPLYRLLQHDSPSAHAAFKKLAQDRPELIEKMLIVKRNTGMTVLHQLVGSAELTRAYDMENHLVRPIHILELALSANPDALNKLLNAYEYEVGGDPNGGGIYPIHKAAQAGNVAAIRHLLQLDSKALYHECYGLNALTFATLIRSWEDEFGIQMQMFREFGLQPPRSDSPIVLQMRADYESRTQKTVEYLNRQAELT